MHEVESLVNFLQGKPVRDHRIDLNFTVQVSFHVTRQLRTAFDSAKGRSPPGASGHQLERSSADLFSGGRDTDDDRFTPPLMATFQRRSHRPDVADTFKGVVDAAVG